MNRMSWPRMFLLFVSGVILCIAGFVTYHEYTFMVEFDARKIRNIENYEAARREMGAYLISRDNPRIQKPSTYRYYGKPVVEGYFYTDKHHQALQKYPNILSCIVPGSNTTGFLDISNFRWVEFKNRDEALLCIFYVGDILRSPTKMQEWLLNQKFVLQIYTGFEAGGKDRENSVRLYAVTQVFTGRKLELWRGLVVEPLKRFLFQSPRYALFDLNNGLAIIFEGDGQVFNTQIISQGK